MPFFRRENFFVLDLIALDFKRIWEKGNKARSNSNSRRKIPHENRFFSKLENSFTDDSHDVMELKS